MTERHDPPHSPPTLTIDWEAYAVLIEDSDWSDEQKRELIETLWSIVVAFVDLGFGVHPAQQACGESDGKDAELHADMLSCLQSPQTSKDLDADGAARHAEAKSPS